MKLIAAADRSWGIGKDGKLLISIPGDMRFFKETTTGHVVVMGRKTLESFPGGRPLKNRINLVLTRDPQYEPEGVTVIRSLSELDRELERFADEEVFVIGGDSIYRQLLDRCDTALITRIDRVFEADAWFPDLDQDPDWELSETGEMQEYEGIRYQFLTYKKKNGSI